MYPLIRLEAPGVETFTVDSSQGVIGQDIDLGDAVTRVVVEDAPNAHGTIDTTEFVGARNITLKLILWSEVDVWTLKQKLRAFTSPSLRPKMYVQETAAAPEQMVVLRRSEFGDVRLTADDAEITVQWVAPSGILESAELHETTISATGSAAVAGMVFPEVFPLVFPASVPIGAGGVFNAGTADVYPIIRIYGPCTDPVVTNVTQGKSLVFVGLTVLVGEYVEIDLRNHTIRYLGLASDSRQNTLSFPASAWFTLSPGVNKMLLQPATFTAPSSMAVIYRDGFL